MKHFLLVSAASAAILSGSAFAQETPAAQPAASAPSESTGGVEEIIVTAQRRAENLQKASVTISVLSAQAIADAGVTQAHDLANVVPGVQIGQAGSATQIYIRGIGDFSNTALANPAVSFNVDGVYVARPNAIEGNFFDIQRVEVLKGPQGTLYGRNSTGGAINVISNQPKLGVREMAASFEIGNYSKIQAEAAVNLPVGEDLAVRVAGQVVSRDGYLTQGADDDVHQSIRGQLLWKPSSALSVRLGGDYIHVGGVGASVVPVGKIAGVNSAWTSVTDPRVAAYYDSKVVALGLCAPIGAQFPTSPGNLTNYTGGACPDLVIPAGPIAGTYPQAQLARSFGDYPLGVNNRFWSAFAELNYDLGFAQFTLLPAYRNASMNYKVIVGGGLSFTPAAGNAPETSKATTIEARLSRNSGAFKGVLGLYYFNEDQAGKADVDGGFVQQAVFYTKTNTKSYAAFGQGTLSISDRFRVIGGLRYTSDKKSADSPVYALLGGAQILPLLSSCTPTQLPDTTGSRFTGCLLEYPKGSVTFKKLTWKAGLEYDLAPDNMIYATASTGYKAGGIYQGYQTPTQIGIYRPERLTSFEAGSRNRFFNNRLQINLDAFYYDYKDHQENIISVDALGVIIASTQNAGQGRSLGGSADIAFKATPDDDLHFGVEYLNTKYTDFVFQSPIAGGLRFISPVGTTCTVTEDSAATNQTINCSGKPFTRSPKWSGVASYVHSFELANGAKIDAKGDMSFQSSRWLGTEYLINAAPYALFNASLTYRSASDALTVSAFIRNIADKAVFTASKNSSFVKDFETVTISPPRTFGMRVSYKY